MLCICASLLTPFAPSFTTLLVSRAIFGVGGALVVTLLGSAILQWFPRKELPIVNGFNYVAVNSGITLSLFITPSIAQSIGRDDDSCDLRDTEPDTDARLARFWKEWSSGHSHSSSKLGKSGKSRKPAVQLYREILQMKEVWLLTIAAAGPLSIYLVLIPFVADLLS